MRGLLDDLRFAARSLRRGALGVWAAIVSIAVGVGAVSAVAGLLSSLLLGAFPAMSEPERIVWIFLTKGALDLNEDAIPAGNYVDLRQELRTVALTAFQPGGGSLVGGREAARVSSLSVAGDFFATLGVRPAAGRAIGPEDEDERSERAMVLSANFHRQAFGGDASVIGREVRLRGEPYRVVGVLPERFGFPMEVDVYTPLRLSPSERAERETPNVVVLGRLSPGATREQADGELTSAMGKLEARYPATNRGVGAKAVPVADLMLGNARRMGAMLVLGSALVLLVACANVAGILAARGAERQGEVALRASLGADAARVARQFLLEAGLIAAAGGGLGLVGAHAALSALAASLPASLVARLPGVARASLDGVALAVGAAATLTATLIAGVFPARSASRVDLSTVLRGSARAAGVSAGRSRARRALVAAEVAVAVGLSLVASRALWALEKARSEPLGYEAGGVFVVNLPRDRRGPEDRAFFERLRRRAAALPGVEAAATAASLPTTRGYDAMPLADGARPAPPLASMPWAKLEPVSAGYLELLRVPLREGRLLTEADGEGSAASVVLSERAAARVLGEGPYVGRTVLLRGEKAARVVGVVGEVLDPLGQSVGRIYRHAAQAEAVPTELLVRAPGDARVVEPLLREAVRIEDAAQPVARVAPLRSLVEAQLWTKRSALWLLASLAALAVALSLVGAYGVAAQAAAERRGELGVRAAVGAGPLSLVGQALREPLGATAAGALAGVTLGVASREAVAALVGDAGAPLSLLSLSAAVVALVVALSALGPALRAALSPPSEALRG